MQRISYRTPLALAVLAALGALAACGEDKKDIIGVPTPNNSIFRSYVALGNSITAGYQSGGLNDSTQRQSYAFYLAKQMGTTYHFASFKFPGCTPPLARYLFPDSVVGAGLPGVTRGTCTLRDAAFTTSYINNTGVPDARSIDLTAPTSANSNALTTLILGGKSQVARALDADPSFVTIWLGNNELLYPASVGATTPIPGASPGIVTLAAFTAGIKSGIDTLRKYEPNIKGVLIGAVDVANAPRLFPANALLDPTTGVPTAFKLSIDAATGKTVTVFPTCRNSQSLISAAIIDKIKDGSYPPIIACGNATVPGVPPQALLGNLFILDSAETKTLQNLQVAYNGYLQAKADSIGFAYFDPNNSTTGLLFLKTSGAIPALPNFTSPTAPFGTYISLDGVHPRFPTHKVIANGLIDVINAKYKTTIPKIADVTTP